MKFLIVDAFTETIFGGNPAGVVFLPEGADFPTDELCVKTAAELRYSETAFVKRLGQKEFQVRYFTPAAEDMLNDLFLGLSVVALGLVIWLAVLLIKDPKGIVKATILKKN